MRPLLFIVVSTLSLIASAALQAQQRVTSQAPNWLLSDSAGEYVSFYEDSGKQASLLLFWTPACGRACLAQMQRLQQEALESNVKPYLLLVSAHTPGSTLPELPSALAPLFNAQAVGRHYGVRGQPTWVLVNAEKTVLQTARFNADTPTLTKLLRPSP